MKVPSRRVALIKAQSAYDALRVFVDELAAAFAARGYEPIVIDALGCDGWLAELEAQGQRGLLLVFTFTILGEFRDACGRTLAAIAQAPHVIHYVDHPFTHIERLTATATEAALLLLDRSHVRAVESVLGPNRFAQVSFSPTAAVGEPREPEDEAVYAARPVPVLFPGTLVPPNRERWAELPEGAQRVLNTAVELALAADWLPSLEAMDQAIRAFGLDPAAEVSGFRIFAFIVNEYVRAYRRVQVLDASARVGLPLLVLGGGYSAEVLQRLSNVTHGGEAPLPAVVQIMGHARIVLNVNVNFGEGGHDRPPTAMAQGALLATDPSTFYEEAFDVTSELAFYRWSRLDEDLAEVARLAADPAAAWSRARAGQARAVAGHRWANRIDIILEAAERARVAQAALAT